MCGQNTCNHSLQLDRCVNMRGRTGKFPLGKEGSGTIYLIMSKFSGISILFKISFLFISSEALPDTSNFPSFFTGPFHRNWTWPMGTVHEVAKSWTRLNDFPFPFQSSRNTELIKMESLSLTLQMHLGNNDFSLFILDICSHMGFQISLKKSCLSPLKVNSLT